ncbi:MAG: sulfotransferase [Pseudomonadota bacterium]
MAHPLSGADLGTLVRAYRQGGGSDKPLATAGIWAAAAARAPLSLLEGLAIERYLPTLDTMEPPIFILGHWRSGTTHLYNMMSLGDFGYVPPVAVGLPWDMFGIARALRPLLERALPEHRWIDRIPVTPVSPQEDEIGLASMTDLSFYHGIYFPHEFDRLIDRGLFFDGCSAAEVGAWQDRFTYFLRKLRLQQGARMLIKNPVYTARAAQLRRLFPDAKFIHIHRNPLDVFLSMRNFYARLLEVMALQEVPRDLDVDATILRVYDRMMTRLVEDTADLGAPDFVELPYAQLDADPIGALRAIYDGLGLPGFESARPKCEEYLARLGTFEKNAFKVDDEAAAKVAAHWTPWIEKWGYQDDPRIVSHVS